MAGRNPNVPWWEEISPEEAQEWINNDPQQVEKYVAQRWQEWNAEQAKLAPGVPNKLSFESQEYDPGYTAAMQTHQSNQAGQATANALRPLLEGLRPPPPSPPPVDIDFVMLGSKNIQDVKKAKENLLHRQFIKEQLNRAAELQGVGESPKDALERAAMMAREVKKTRRESPYSFQEENDRLMIEDAQKRLEQAEKLTPEEIEANRPYFKTLAESFNHEHNGEFSYVLDDREAPKIIRVDHAGKSSRHIAQMEKPDFLLPWRIQDHVISDAPKKETAEEVPKAADDKWESQKAFEQEREAEGARKF